MAVLGGGGRSSSPQPNSEVSQGCAVASSSQPLLTWPHVAAACPAVMPWPRTRGKVDKCGGFCEGSCPTLSKPLSSVGQPVKWGRDPLPEPPSLELR